MKNFDFKVKTGDLLQKQLKNLFMIYNNYRCCVVFDEKEKLKVTITSDYMIFQDGLINGEINMTLEDLAKLMQAGFNKLDSKIEETNTKIEETENRLNKKIEETNTKIEETENRLNTKIEETESRLNKKLDFHETLFKEHG